MIQIPVYSPSGDVVRQVEVEQSRLGGTVKKELLRQAVVAYEANARVGTAKAKTRAEVVGSGRKPWRQKGTGRARAGSVKSPIWVGGGVAHGPRPRDYSQKLNKKVRRKALRSALLAKMLDGEVKVIEALELPEPKTREMARILKNAGVQDSFLIVVPEHDDLLWRCTRNIPGSAVRTVLELNAREVLVQQHVVFTSEALRQVLERFGEEPVPAPRSEEPAAQPGEAT